MIFLVEPNVNFENNFVGPVCGRGECDRDELQPPYHENFYTD